MESSKTKRSVLISGGAAGIGRVIAEMFLAQGDNVRVCDNSAERLADFSDANPNAATSLVDVASSDDVQGLFESVGALDILVNNAGISGPSAGVENVEPSAWDQCLAVNLSGAFYMTHHAVPLLKQSKAGSIINIASSAGLFGTPMRSPYAASKWGLIGLTKTWAMELGPQNIRVNAVCPGCVEGPRIEGVIERDAAERGVSEAEIREVYQRQSSMRTFVSPREIAETVLFLASEKASKISGQALSVDGHTESLAIWLD